MIAFVDEAPAVEVHGGHFLITATSGGEEIKLLLTQKALSIFHCHAKHAIELETIRRFDECSVVALRPRRKKG